jgi:hypothetical protein
MVEDMVRAARIGVFFLDETQRVQWNDCGSESRIRAAAKKFTAHKKFTAQVHPPVTLNTQFRCGGSDGYLNWLDDVLQIRPTGNFDNWADEQYGFRVFDDAAELYRELRARNAGNKARLAASTFAVQSAATAARTPAPLPRIVARAPGAGLRRAGLPRGTRPCGGTSRTGRPRGPHAAASRDHGASAAETS